MPVATIKNHIYSYVSKHDSMIKEIETLDDPEIAIFSRLTESQIRNRLEPENGIFIAESPKVIRSALDAGIVPLAILTEQRFVESQALPIVNRCGDLPIYTGSNELLRDLTGYELSRGIICAMRRPQLPDMESICHDKNRIVVIDSVVNATNTGAIFRAAAALGIDAILLTHTSCDPLNRRSVRVSMGTVFQIPWCFIGSSLDEWPQPGIDQLKKMGFRTAALALNDSAISIDNPALKAENHLAIILGSEGDGLSTKTIDQCDFVVRIPMFNGVDSLNVAAASAVAFWELRKEAISF